MRQFASTRLDEWSGRQMAHALLRHIRMCHGYERMPVRMMRLRMSRSSVFLVALAVAVGGAVSVLGEAPVQAPEAPFGQLDDQAVARAPVVIDGEELFGPRHYGLSRGTPRQQRSKRRIRALARNTRAGTPVLTRQDDGRGRPGFSPTGGRFCRASTKTRRSKRSTGRILAEAYQARIGNAIAAYRAARQPAVLWRNAFLTVARRCCCSPPRSSAGGSSAGCTDASSAATGTQVGDVGSSRSRSEGRRNSGGRSPAS